MFRRLPPVCLLLGLYGMLTGKLTLSKQFVGSQIRTEKGKVFRVFRNIRHRKEGGNPEQVVFVVRFRFAKLSHKANKIASLIPMLIIAGHPGFMQKIYAVDQESGSWQGMYQWKSIRHLKEYKGSFVYKMMNKRAIKRSIHSFEITNSSLTEFIEKSKENEE